MDSLGPFSHTPRLKRVVDPSTVRVAMREEIALTACLSETFRSHRRVGGRQWTSDGRIGQLFVYTPDDVVDVSAAGVCRLIQVKLGIERLRTIAEEDHGVDADFLAMAAYDGRTDHRMTGLLCHLVMESASRAEIEREIVARLLERSRGGNGVVAYSGGIAPARLRRVVEHVESRLERVTLASMAAEAALSPFHFARGFKRSVGQAPWSYVIERRVARSVALAADTDLPLAEIARSVGFASASHLVSIVRKRLLSTPDRLRSMMGRID